MAEQEVRSPVSRPSGKVGSGQPMSLGARSNQSRGRSDPSWPQPAHGARATHSNGEQPGEDVITGPKPVE